nr:MAG: hypothetical protein [Microviridae sp.]
MALLGIGRIHMNVEKTPNLKSTGEKQLKQVRKVEHLDNTPFDIIENEETGKYYIFWGTNRMNPTDIETLKEAKNYVEQNKWEMIATMAVIVCNKMYEKTNDKKTA